MPKKRRRKQVAALPYDIDDQGDLRILLVTSRDTGRWVLPKGWPMAGRSMHKAAGIEAYEEAGVVGRTAKNAVGTYDYDKIEGKSATPCRVHVFPMPVDDLLDDWPEAKERERTWHTPTEATAAVDEKDLKALFSSLGALLDLSRE